MLADYHVHTSFSYDSTYEMEEVINDAISKGIEELCFTEHIDYGIKKDVDEEGEVKIITGGPDDPPFMKLLNVDYPKYYQTVKEFQKKYADKISIKLGLEFGIQMHTIDRYETLFKKYPFDFIILSIHEIDNQELWNQEFQTRKTWQEYNDRYYQEMLKVVQNYHNYSVLGHLDLVSRYDKNGRYPFEKEKEIITEILKTVIADNKGIEVNTSSFRYGLDDLTPAKDILKLFLELGGNIITIGSDSHKPKHLGAHIEEVKSILKEIGFKQFCTYENMQPIFWDL